MCLGFPLYLVKLGELWLSHHCATLTGLHHVVLAFLRPRRKSFEIYLDYLMGFLILVCLMHVGKSSTGVFRPHFYDVCRPNLTAPAMLECLSAPYGFVEDPQCTNKLEPRKIKQARESFPSGHSACAVYALAFIYYYFTIRLATILKDRPVFRTIHLYGFLLFTVVCCATRVTDHWHHVSDVVGGVVLGVGVAHVMFASRDGAFSRRYGHGSPDV